MSLRTKKVLGEYRCGLCKAKHTIHDDYLCPSCRAKQEAKKAAEDLEREKNGWNMALLRARRERKISINDLAKAASITAYSYKQYEQGKSDPKNSTRVRIARALGAKPEELWPYAHLVRCRTCMRYFETETEVTCPACKEAARREAEGRVSRLTGANEKEISRIAREARRQGLSYGKAVALEHERR